MRSIEFHDGVFHVERWMSIVWPEGYDVGNNWRASTRETEVGLDGWCKGGLGQQRNDGGGCTSMHERLEIVESHGTYVTERVSHGHFCLALCSFGPPSHALVVITWRGVGCSWDKL